VIGFAWHLPPGTRPAWCQYLYQFTDVY